MPRGETLGFAQLAIQFKAISSAERNNEEMCLVLRDWIDFRSSGFISSGKKLDTQRDIGFVVSPSGVHSI